MTDSFIHPDGTSKIMSHKNDAKKAAAPVEDAKVEAPKAAAGKHAKKN